MHVPWGWIKQRPHFLAEGLSKEYHVDVLVKKDYSQQTITNNTDVNLINIPRLPLERLYLIRLINKIIQKIYLWLIVKKYDIIWITCPSEIAFDGLRFINSNQLLIYDCMDDAIEFYKNKDLRAKIFNAEKKIFNRSDIIFCSAEYLKGKIVKRYGNKQIYVINNALLKVTDNSVTSNQDLPLQYDSTTRKKIVYIGTVSEWIDFNLVAKLAELDNVELYFFGPYKDSITKEITHSNVYFMGSIEHKQVNKVMQKADILIMPFIVNELILSVNPVKLYEYISSGKPCFAPKYGETMPFEEYCYLYSSDEECVKLINDVLYNDKKAKQGIRECVRFANKNTWTNRVEQILNVIHLFENR